MFCLGLHIHAAAALVHICAQPIPIQAEQPDSTSPDRVLSGLLPAGDRTLAECFVIFGLIHELTCHHDTISRIAQEAVEDFAADRVVYLELRTTPKVRRYLSSSLPDIKVQ
jgi:hypothetical protein